MSQANSPLRPAPLAFNSPRASPFRRPESPLGRSPSTVRASTPTNTSPLKQSNPADSALRSSANMQSSPARPSPISRPSADDMSAASPSRTSRPAANAFSSSRQSRGPPSHASKIKDPLSHIPPQQLHTMRESFAVLDRNNAGTVTPADVSDMLSQLGLDSSPSALASFFPSSGGGISATSGGGINLATYLNTLASSLAPLSDPSELLAAFSAFDNDDSGQIAIDELRDALVHTAPEPGEQRLTEREIDSVVEGFSGRRAFGKGQLGKAGGGNREEVFKYRDFVAAVGGTGAPSAETQP